MAIRILRTGVTDLIGREDGAKIVRRWRSLRAQRERVGNLERRTHGQALSQVRTSTIEEEIRQVSTYDEVINTIFTRNIEQTNK